MHQYATAIAVNFRRTRFDRLDLTALIIRAKEAPFRVLKSCGLLLNFHIDQAILFSTTVYTKNFNETPRPRRDRTSHVTVG